MFRRRTRLQLKYGEIAGAAAEVRNQDRLVARDSQRVVVRRRHRLVLEDHVGPSGAPNGDIEAASRERLVRIAGGGEMNGTPDDYSRRQFAELRNRSVAQRGDDWRDQISQGVGLAHDVGRFETLVGEKRLERLHEPPVARGCEITANRVVADGDGGVGAARFLDRLEKQDRAKRLGLIATLSGGKARQARRSVGADDSDCAVGGAKIETDRGYFGFGASVSGFMHHAFTIKARLTLVNVELRAYTRQTLRMTIALRLLIRNPVAQRTRFSSSAFFSGARRRCAQEGENAAANSRVRSCRAVGSQCRGMGRPGPQELRHLSHVLAP